MLILSLNLKKYILKIYKKINLIINKSSCLLGKKLFHRERERERERGRERERESYKIINSYEYIQYVYPSNTNTCVCYNLEKKKKTWGVRGILWKDHWWIYISFEILIIDF